MLFMPAMRDCGKETLCWIAIRLNFGAIQENAGYRAGGRRFPTGWWTIRHIAREQVRHPAKLLSAQAVLWKVRAPMLTYWADEGTAQLEGGVQADSSEGSLESRTLEVFLGPATSPSGGDKGSRPVTGALPTTSLENGGKTQLSTDGRQLNRVVAQGNVVVRQGDRRGMAEQAEYTAADGKFVLSGGQPTLADASSDTTTGHSLTFFVANDTILIDSQEGSRTLTKHRVEK